MPRVTCFRYVVVRGRVALACSPRARTGRCVGDSVAPDPTRWRFYLGSPADGAYCGAMSTDDEPAEDPANPAASSASSPAEDPATPADDAAGPAGPSAAGAVRARGIGRQGSYSKGIARRQEILDRAIEVFRDRGADGTSLRRIAEAIGVSHGALLHYFSSREELLVAVYEHAERRSDLDRLEREGPSALDDELAVEVMANAALANLEVPGLVQLYSTLVATSLESERGPAKEFFTARFENVRGSLATRLREDQAAGRVRGDVDPEQMAALIVAASDGLQIQWLLEPSIQLQQTLELFAVLLEP